MAERDKDIRFMATNDLLAALNKESFRLDERMERKVVKVIIGVLDDPNTEVQNVAVKTLPPLVAKIAQELIPEVTNPLIQNILSPEEQKRDIASIGTKPSVLVLEHWYETERLGA